MVNFIIAGDYKGKALACGPNKVILSLGFFKNININKETLESYELITEEHVKSATSGATRGLVGGALLGPVGMLAGVISAKNKKTYHVVLEFKDGKRSLAEINNKLYTELMKIMF